MAVEQNDYELVKMLCEYKGCKCELGLKDRTGKNPVDIAVEREFTGIYEVLSKHGGSPSLEVIKGMQQKKYLLSSSTK